MALTHEDQNVGRILESMLNVFLSKSPNKSQPGNKKLSKEEKRMKKFFKRCIRSVKKNGLMLQCIAEEYRTPGLCNKAIKQNGNALEFVPAKHRTPALCMQAIKKNPEAIKFVPEELKSICQTQLDLQRYVSKDHWKWLRTPFNKIRTFLNPPFERKSSALINCLNILQGINTEGKTKQQLKNELLENFKILPDNAKNFDFCKKVIDYNSLAIPFMPPTFYTQDMCREVVTKNYQSLKNLPESQKTPEICLIAYLKNSKALEYIPFHLKREIVEQALSFNKSLSNINSQQTLESFLNQWGKLADYILPADFIKTQMEKLIPPDGPVFDSPQAQTNKEQNIRNNLENHLSKELLTPQSPGVAITSKL